MDAESLFLFFMLFIETMNWHKTRNKILIIKVCGVRKMSSYYSTT